MKWETSMILYIFAFLIQFRIFNLQESIKCRYETTCSKCIQADVNCAWCKAENADFNPRCDSVNNIKIKCPKEDIIAPQTNLTTIQDEALNMPGELITNTVQLKPQRVHLKIRPNSPHKLKVQFRQAEDQQVDLYYLMDLSDSMRDDKEKLTALATLLGNTMKNLTRNFQLGFGTFIDKIVLPYANTAPEKLIAPCQECSAPYGFINNLPLNENTSLFEEEVRRSQISGNLDGPEGSLDGVMQAIVCTKKIGWREQARKILLLTTDASFHTAGDGKLGGIIPPNDEVCHLDVNGSYAKSTKLDYPSVSQIIRQVEEHNITMLFAVTPNVIPVYEELRKLIKGSYIAELAKNSENIVELVKEQYEQISSTIEFQDDSPDNIRVLYHTNCLSLNDTYQQTNICNNLKDGTTVDFEIMIEVTYCPADKKDHKQIFNIFPLGLSETLTIELDLICECDCEQPDSQKINDTKCSGVGTYQCGICQCPINKYGEFCQCDGSENIDVSNKASCRKDSSASICSGQGICICGKCVCHQPFESLALGHVYGPYCECDNFTCSYHNGLLCGGPEHGKCECSSCNCKDEWIGETCECPSTNDSCSGLNKEICSGHGICECGKCHCTPPYTGYLCETIFTPGRKCNDLRPCAECIISGNNMECEQCANLTVEVIPQLKGMQEGEHQCKFKQLEGCYIFYAYKTEGQITIIRVQTELLDCPAPINVASALGIVIGIIVGIGLLALAIWKLVTTMHDHQEYVRFEEERLNAQLHQIENPLYKDVITTFPNPTFGREHLD